jgi:LEA14-like dessication related protein
MVALTAACKTSIESLKRMRTFLLLMCLSLAACKTVESVAVEVSPPTIGAEAQLAIANQSLTEVALKLTLPVAAGAQGVTVDKLTYEFVVEEKVLKQGEQQIGRAIAAGTSGDVLLEQSFTYVRDADALKAMDSRGGSMLMALRGTLFATVDTGAERKSVEVPFARAKEVRTPRLPHLKVLEPEAGRFSEAEVQAAFHLSINNPNPFQVAMTQVSYEISLAGKKVVEGVQGQGEKLSPAAAGVFDVTAVLSEATHEKEAKKIVKGLLVPYVVKAVLKTPLYEEPVEATGTIKLTPAK